MVSQVSKASKNVKRIIRIALLVGTVYSLTLVPWPILFAWLTPREDTVQEQVNKIIDYDFDGIIVYVDQAGKDPETYTAGWHDKDAKIPARPDAIFKIASISKLYDVVAITKLASSGKISLDKTLADYFPELVGRIENADQITIRLMVMHRSGIPNFTDTKNFWVNPPDSKEAALELILDQPADFAPDEEWAYSNTNYLLLGELIEKVTGDGPQYYREAIFEPLGLQNTFVLLEEVNMDHLMSGYYVGIEKDLKYDDSGSIMATAEDVGIFLRALNDGSVFKEGEQDIYSSLYLYSHTGLIPGYQSIARYYKDIDTVVILFTNTTNFSGYNWNIMEITYSRILKIIREDT